MSQKPETSGYRLGVLIDTERAALAIARSKLSDSYVSAVLLKTKGRRDCGKQPSVQKSSGHFLFDDLGLNCSTNRLTKSFSLLSAAFYVRA